MGRTINRPAPSGHGRALVFAAMAAVLLLACLARIPALADRAGDADRFTHGPGLPVLANLDGYHYLSRARDLVRQWRGQPPLPTADPNRPASMLDALAASLNLATGLPLERIALYLPPMAGLFMLAFYLLWGRASGNAWAGVLAALAGTFAPLWFRRTAPGFFDTDALNPFFISMAALSAYLFARGRGPARLAWLGGCLACLAGLAWWWRPGIAGAVLALLAAAYAASVFTPELKRDAWLKYGLLGCMMIGAAGLFVFMARLPVPVREFFQSAAAHLHLVAKQAAGPLPEVGASITELSRPGITEAAAALGGRPLALAGLAGLGLMAWKRPGQTLFLLPLLALGGLGFAAKRFLIFAAPLTAVGFGFLVIFLWNTASFSRVQKAVTAAVAVAVLGWSGYVCLRDQPPPFVTGPEVELAAQLRDTPPDTVVWTWWDYGYLAEYASERRAFITGGSQSPLRTYLAARGLAAADPRFASRWMRYFASLGPAAFESLAKKLGGPGQAAAEIDLMLARQGSAPDAPPVAVYLPAPAMNMAAWIFQYATWDFQTRASKEPAIARIDNTSWRIDTGTGLLSCDMGTLPLARASILEPDGRASTMAFDPQRDATLATVRGWPYAYVLGKRMSGMLMVRLLALSPAATPGFGLKRYSPDAGGVWLAHN